MRTTIDIDDDVLAAARSLAAGDGSSLGKTLSVLARRGLEPRPSRTRRKGFPTFSVPRGTAPLTPEMVRRAQEDEP